jgi:hypothetical protein
MIELCRVNLRFLSRGKAMKRSRAGGVLFGLLVGVGMLVVFGVLLADYLVTNVRVEHLSSLRGERTRIETPLGSIGVDARDKLNPESVGIPVYPGARRETDNSGGAFVDFDWDGMRHKQLSVVGASFTTSDSAQQVREFYHTKLPHWIFTQKHDGNCSIEFSKEGYKRIVAIEQRGGRTHIGVVSIGEGGVN